MGTDLEVYDGDPGDDEIVDAEVVDDDQDSTGDAGDGAEPQQATLGPTVRAGDQLASLTRLRDRIADQLDLEVESKAVATLSRQLTDVMDRIEQLGGATKADGTSPIDEIARRRRKRAAASA